MITTVQDSYMKNLIRNLEMLWIVRLNDGTMVYSDYYKEGLESPWERLKKHCQKNDLYPVSVESLIFGSPNIIMAQNPNGLDGFFVLRGSSKDYNVETGEGTSYRNLVVGVLDDEKDIINVTKFSWPLNELDPFNQERLVTKENAELMFFKNDSELRNREIIHLSIDG